MNSKAQEKFVNGLNLPEVAKKAILQNVLAMTVFNIIIKGKKIAFDWLTTFDTVERIEIEEGTTYLIWEVFAAMRNQKNAINTLTAIAEGSVKALTPQVIKDQSRITPKMEVTATSFNTFLASLTPEMTETLLTACKAWFEANLYSEMPNFFKYNKINDFGLKAGDCVIYTETPHSYYGRILQAIDGGWITVAYENGYHTIAESSTVKVINSEEIPAEHLKEINAQFEKFTEAGELARAKAIDDLSKVEAKIAEKQTKNFERLNARRLDTRANITAVSELVEKAILTAENREELIAKIELAKAEVEKVSAEKAQIFETLKTAKMETAEQIKPIVSMLNSAKLPAEQHAEIKALIQKANEAIKATKALETTKATVDKAKAKETAKANATATATAKPAPKAETATAKAKPAPATAKAPKAEAPVPKIRRGETAK